jgi:hypothetical protein
MSIQLRDPVHNFLTLYDDEVKLMDTWAIQRLRGIHQLALAKLVYPGSVHTRFDHSLGVAHVAGLMATELGLGEDDVRLVRIAGIVHDIGHGPFSHVSEHALEVYADRSSLKPEQKQEKIHELISARIIETDKEIVRILGQAKCGNIVKLLGEGHGQPALKSIVSGPLDADKQDYLLRDSLFCGVPYGVFDIHQMHRSLTLHGPDDEKQLMIKPDGIHAVEQYIMAKYYLTTNVYRHRVRLITDQMIVRAIQLGIEKDQIERLASLYRFDNSARFVDEYCSWDDGRFMQEFCINSADTRCKRLLSRLLRRKLLKRVFDARLTDFKADVADILPQLTKVKRELRARIEAAIAEELSTLVGRSVDPDQVIVNIFNIRSVRETSRNDSAPILVARRSQDPEPFEEASSLFASIDARYSDEFVEVYAPVDWDTDAEKSRIRRVAREMILKLIEQFSEEKGAGV